jgi:hypothetical protein
MPVDDKQLLWVARVLGYQVKERAGAAADDPGPRKSAVAYAKSRLAWLAARAEVERGIAALRQELARTFAKDGFAAELDKAYASAVSPILGTLDETLADQLDAALNATEPGERQKRVGEAQATIARYRAFVAEEAFLAGLDDNPLVPLAITKTLTSTLDGLAAAVR